MGCAAAGVKPAVQRGGEQGPAGEARWYVSHPASAWDEVSWGFC